MPLERRERAIAHGGDVKPAYAAFGDPVGGAPNATGDTSKVQPAGVFSTAPYLPDGITNMPPKVRKTKQLCAFPDKPCRAYATATGYCVFHNQSMKARGELT